MNNTIKLSVTKNGVGVRVDVFLASKLENYTRSFIKKLIKNKFEEINKKEITSSSIKLKYNDKIKIFKLNDEENKLVPKNINLDIIYEDQDLLLVNKPKGMVVHPGAGSHNNTLANALAFRYKSNLSNINGSLRPGIVHRIDKDTSGILVIAKNNFTHAKLGKQFSDHTIKRKYQCLIWGVIRPLNGRIETLIGRNIRNRQLMTVKDFSGKKAITNYKTIRVFKSPDIPTISLLECNLETGRTHQIRVHLKFKGSSIIGDKQYGKKNIKFKKLNNIFFKNLNNINGQVLHAQTLEFMHPTKDKWVKFSSNPPNDFKKIVNLLEKLSS